MNKKIRSPKYVIELSRKMRMNCMQLKLMEIFINKNKVMMNIEMNF
jgi:hypothetical protein